VKIDFHIHTSFSFDGISSPYEVVAAAISRGLDCICIADHGETRGAVEALRFASSKPLLVMPGIEVKSKEGDVLAVNIREKIPKGLSAKETILEIDRLGGMAVIPHPFVWLHSFRGDLEKLCKENLPLAIEVFNASMPNIFNKKALEFAEKFNLPFTVGSDAHIVDTIGKAFLEVPGNNLSPNEILEEVKKKSGKIIKEKISSLDRTNWIIKRNIRRIKNRK
jgi:predicted metal-dependent phosphoesterase TrpH